MASKSLMPIVFGAMSDWMKSKCEILPRFALEVFNFFTSFEFEASKVVWMASTS